MPFLRLLVIVLTIIGTCTVLAPVFQKIAHTTTTVLTPFMLISAGILIAAIGYAVGNFKK